MKIRIDGTPQNSTRRFLCRALRFYMRYLMRSSSVEELTIHLRFSSTPGDEGLTDWLDRPDRAKKFRITLHHSLSESRLLEVLAHECVHVKQYSTGQLRDYRNDDTLCRWEGEVYYHDHETPDYWFQPWELEARSMERALHQLFIEDYNSRV